MTTLVERLDFEHQPMTPRTHDARGHRIHEDAQCRACLQVWPCETSQLLAIIGSQAGEIRRLSDRVVADD